MEEIQIVFELSPDIVLTIALVFFYPTFTNIFVSLQTISGDYPLGSTTQWRILQAGAEGVHSASASFDLITATTSRECVELFSPAMNTHKSS